MSMSTTTTPAAGEIITKPRGLFIDFRNLMGREINADHVESLTKDFIRVSGAVGAYAAITCDKLAAEPVPGDKRSEKLVPGGLYDSKNEKLRYLRLAFAETAKGKSEPLSASLILDLRNREAKSATLTVHAPDGDESSRIVYNLYENLESLLNKGLLNSIAFKLTTRDKSLTMSQRQHASSSFTLRF
jgi:hypothetical protein